MKWCATPAGQRRLHSFLVLVDPLPVVRPGVKSLARSRDYLGVLFAGSLLGLLIVAGWWVTGVLALDDFDPLPPSSLAVAGPLALVPGVLIGALAAAVIAGEFCWIPPAGDRVGAYLVGGILMGFGATVAGGRNIGQGLTGLSRLSITSLLAVFGIFAGILLGLFWVSRSSALNAAPAH